MIRYRTPARSARHARQRAGFARWFDVYDCAAEAWRTRAEHETVLYPTELRDFRRDNPPPNLKSYMLATAGQPRP